MNTQTITVSEQFKKKTINAVLAIVFFILVYLLLIAAGIAITFLSGLGGVSLIALRPSFITIMLGLGLISVGILIMLFLIKFIFKKHKVDRSNLIEITAEDQPDLFAFINDIVQSVQTDFPKKVFLTSDVNASVFYDSSFWSMFLPVKKNLNIGLGLVNSISRNELRAILAHEFGHFSQRSMKVGSYVYHVNQVIYNMLYDNDSYNKIAEKWAGVSSYFTPFVMLAFKIVRGIQKILNKVYEVVNLRYMALSREMEFHADAVAASVAGVKPIETSLLRLQLSDAAYDSLLNHFNGMIEDSKRTKNIYPSHLQIMNFLAKENGTPVQNNFPLVSRNGSEKYNKSKLNINNQWASHPSTEDRIASLEKLGLSSPEEDWTPANTLLKNIDEWQEKVTEIVFSPVNYKQKPENVDTQLIIQGFIENYRKNQLDKLFNGYYDYKIPGVVMLDIVDAVKEDITPQQLFSEEMVNMVYAMHAMRSDLDVINKISDKTYDIKSFDYEGVKYTSKEAKTLLPTLELELKGIEDNLLTNDQKIYNYFYSAAQSAGKEHELKENYREYLNFDKTYDKMVELYNKMHESISFIHEQLAHKIIQGRLKVFSGIESQFIISVKEMLQNPSFTPDLTDEFKAQLIMYSSGENEYFYGESYDEGALERLFKALTAYQVVAASTYQRLKKSVFDNFTEIHSLANGNHVAAITEQ